MVRISGLNELQRTLSDAQKALDSLDGELGSVRFDPFDPTSIEAALQTMESVIDDRCGPYVDNPIIAPLIEQAKAAYRQAILDRAAATRLAGGKA